MIQKYFGLGLSVFAMACVPMGLDDTGAEPSKEPSSEPSSDPTGGSSTGGSSTGGGGDPITLIYTDFWTGELSLDAEGNGSGWESYDLNDGTGEEIYVNRSLSEMDEDPYDGILFILHFSKNLD